MLEAWRPFLDAVDQAYGQFDDDRKMLERSLDLSSTELVEANSQMQAIFNAFPDLFFILDGEGRILDHKNLASDASSTKGMVGKRIQDVPSPQARGEFQRALQLLKERRDMVSIEYSLDELGVPEHFEARLLHLPDDKIIVIVRNISARKKAEDAIQNAQLLLEEKVEARTRELRETNESLQREVTERQRAEAALQKTEARFRMLIEQLPTITYIMEAKDHGRWRYVSPQIEAMVGFTPEEWMATTDLHLRLVHPDDLSRLLEEKTRSRDTGTPYECEYRVFSRDGRLVWCRDQAVLVWDEEAQERLFQGVILDITERKHLEDQLRQSMKMEAIGRLAGGIAHDFNNILTAMMGDSYLIRDLIGNGHPASEYVDAILISTQRAAGLTQQLLAYSRRQMLQPKVFDLNILITQLEGMLKRLIGENIELEASTREAALFIKADPGQIEQVIINLVVNARDAMPTGGKISIETATETINEAETNSMPEAPPGDYVSIEVRDTGTGISPQDMPNLFEPFFTTKPQGQGTGLGLATCYGIVHQSGGFISVQSCPNQGAVFKILLHKVEQDLTLQTPPRHATEVMARGHETILLVEDELMVRSLAAEMLRRLGYQVHEASNGEEALRVFETIPNGRVDLLLTDMVMPQMGGMELAEQLLARQPTLEVIYMSGYTADRMEDGESPALGANFLQKPFTPPYLAQKVRESLGRALTA